MLNISLKAVIWHCEAYRDMAVNLKKDCRRGNIHHSVALEPNKRPSEKAIW